jgi:2-amino-4-hydroxy-6-hydroxymethyldihydropteridine diphosphokinase
LDIKSFPVYLGLGSNLGEKQEYLKRALDYISQRMRVEKASSIYDTEPIGSNPDQPRFLNLVCRVTTSVPPNMLLFLTKGIESKLGRLPGPKDGPRVIDIDILLYGDQIIDLPDLKIPHPRMLERAFVLVPLVEIAPEAVHPVEKKTIKEIFDSRKVGTQGVLKLK